MAIINFNPVTPSQRNLVLVDKKSLWRGSSLKSLTIGKHSKGGRSNIGKATVAGRSRGVKKKYRVIDYKRNKPFEAVIERLEYDPNRSAHIALLKYSDGEYSYIIAPDAVSVGDKLISSHDAEIKSGNCLPLKNIPSGTTVHNVEMKIGKGGQLARSAGSYAVLINKDNKKAYLRMRSGEVRIVEADCKATIGIVSNLDNKNIKLGKAGRKRWMGRRPKVRGVAMNPVDHPHGGGEGKSSGGRHPVNKNGLLTKGYKTRNNKRTDKFIFKNRNKKS
jgi:large subunit ribosomal protein L2